VSPDVLTTTWHQDLPEYMSISVEGVVTGVDPEITHRQPGRVVLSMPDFTADNLGRVLAKAWKVAQAMNDPSIGPVLPAMLYAHEPAAFGGYGSAGLTAGSVWVGRGEAPPGGGALVGVG